MADSSQKPEITPKKPSVTESVQSLIERKKSEQEVEVSESASEKMAGTVGEVAEVMTGVEKPKEKVSKSVKKKSEGKGLKGGKSTTGDDDAQQIRAQLKDYSFPSEEIMVKKIRTAITAQIKLELAKAKRFEGSLSTGGAEGYSAAIAKVRRLKEVIASLFTSTVDLLKTIYAKYFTSDGKRKKFEEI